jgi:hypothetical protein
MDKMVNIFVALTVFEGVLIFILLILLFLAQSKIRQLRQDNRELLRRLRILSKSKIVD